MKDAGLWAAVAAVIVDSIVTIFVGWKLNRTARQETSRALDQVKPALKAEMEKAALILIPLMVQQLKHLLDNKEKAGQGETSGTLRSISHESSTNIG